MSRTACASGRAPRAPIQKHARPPRHSSPSAASSCTGSRRPAPPPASSRRARDSRDFFSFEYPHLFVNLPGIWAALSRLFTESKGGIGTIGDLRKLGTERCGEVLWEDPICPWVADRSEEHTSELQSLMRISSAVFCLKQKTNY